MPDSLVDLLARSVQLRPQAEALVQAERRISYAELWSGISAVAARLRRCGLQPGGRVALLLEASPEYVAAYYGVLAAGGVVVALNPAAKAREIAVWLRHSEAEFLVAGAHPELAEALAEGCSCRFLRIAELNTWREGPGVTAEFAVPVGAAAPAAIIYTSGTTGSPKGVTLSHRNLVSNVSAVVEYLRLTADDRVVHVLPFHYCYGNSVLHTHLAAGATVIIEGSLVYPHRVLERMVKERATGFSGVPATYALLLSRTDLGSSALRSLRYLTQAGGAMTPADIARVRALLPQVEFFVMYGQTEATSRLSYMPPEYLASKPGSVGIAIADTEIAVLDDDGQPLPAGRAGHICARGPGVMLGYWCDPEATKQVLRAGWLWTGDLGYLDVDGFLYVQGRSSELIKTGAHRVSPNEIEEVLLALDGVAEAVAAGMPDPLLGQVIKAWLVIRPGAQLDTREVLAHCRRSLPLYKVPKQIVFTDALPRTASGKVRRAALAEFDVAGQED
ncbi:MAG TPA: AMP-binding protein [Gammaproteobacteria bacterium]|nr:AMP-binding protein [Gammaproteobacteria bacterium]